MKTRIIHNRIQCKKCGDIIESFAVHDFKFCSCGAVAVDGGHDYLKRSGNKEDWKEISITKVIDDKELELRRNIVEAIKNNIDKHSIPVAGDWLVYYPANTLEDVLKKIEEGDL